MLSGMKVGILVTEGFGQVEPTAPMRAQTQAHA
jgi:hypothetical protein